MRTAPTSASGTEAPLKRADRFGHAAQLAPAAIIGCCLVILAGTVAIGAIPSAREVVFGAALPELSYAVGETIDLPASTYRGRDRTIFLFARGGCAPSARALDVIRDNLRRGQPDVPLSIIVGTRHEDLALAADLNSSVVVHSIGLSALRLKRVPALVAVDREGTIQSVHEGELTATLLHHAVATEPTVP
jgi:hypothetical protein